MIKGTVEQDLIDDIIVSHFAVGLGGQSINRAAVKQIRVGSRDSVIVDLVFSHCLSQTPHESLSTSTARARSTTSCMSK